MYQYSNSLIRQFSSAVTGNAAVDVQATVYVGETNTLASLFESNGVTPKSNPVTTDSKGFYSFSLADGDYRIVFSSSQFATLRISVLDGAAIREEFDSFVAAQGFYPVAGSFEAGGTITERNQVLQRTTAPAAYFSWGGALPKVVPPSSTVEGTGGEAVTAWTNRNDATLAGALADGTANVGGINAGDLGRKFKDSPSIYDFGATGDGVADDTAAVVAALATGKQVIVPQKTKLKITSSVLMPIDSSIIFEGSLGNTADNLPSSYIIKDASIAGPAITMQECCQFIGGGVVGEAGNTGDGIVVWGNSVFIDRPLVTGCGGDGIRVGRDDAYRNCNSAYINKPVTCNNGGQGIHIHDGFSDSTGAADANAGTLIHPFSFQNGGSGILMKRAWWWTVINPLTEGNGAWGMFVDNTVVAPDTVPRCRYLQIFGGDFNEGNVGGSLFFGGYICCLYMSTGNQQIVKGGLLNNIFGGAGDSENWGQTVNNKLVVNDGLGGGVKFPHRQNSKHTGTVGDSSGISINMGDGPDQGLFPETSALTGEFNGAGFYNTSLWVTESGVFKRGLTINPAVRRWYPPAGNNWDLGDPSFKFRTIFTALPVYANDTAAGNDGLAIGGMYQNGDGVVRVRLT